VAVFYGDHCRCHDSIPIGFGKNSFRIKDCDRRDKYYAFHLLLQRVEGLLSKKNTEWEQSVLRPPKEKNRAQGSEIMRGKDVI
jgi:hypothetical protein